MTNNVSIVETRNDPLSSGNVHTSQYINETTSNKEMERPMTKKELRDSLLPLPLGQQLETVLELDSMNTDKSVTSSAMQSPQSIGNSPITHLSASTTNTFNYVTRPRTRTDSLKTFTDKFRSISNDLLRSIESAHEMIDLNRSHFSAATQSAAAQQYHDTVNPSTPNHSRWPKVKRDFLKIRANAVSDTVDELYGHSDPLSVSTIRSGPDKRDDDRDADGESFNDLNSVRDSTSLSSINEHEANSNCQNNSRIKRIANSERKHDGYQTDESLTIRESSYYSPKNSEYHSPKSEYEKTFILPNRPKLTRTIDESNAINNNCCLIDNNNKKPTNFTNSFSSSNSSINLKKTHSNYVDSSLKTKNGLNNNRKTLIKNRKGATTHHQHPMDQTDFQVHKTNSKKIIPDDIHISILEVFIYLWGVITFFADLISDIILSVEYLDNKQRWLGVMTLMFTIVPNVTLSLFSLSWYIDKYYQEKQLNQQNLEIKRTQQQHYNATTPPHRTSKISSTCDSITFWITTIFFVVFQLDLVWKYIQGFVYTLKGWACRSLFKNLKWEKYYIEKQIKCDTDIGMLRLIDVFMDSGPQVLLQLYVITTQNLNKLGIGNLVVFTFKDFRTTSLELKQFVSILSSLFSMGYALAGYHRCLRNQQFIFCLETNKPLPRPMSWLSTIMQFLWYLFLIAPRVLAMAIFASTFRSWFFMIMFTHWFIMYFWILRLKTNYCLTSPQDEYNAREEIFEKFYNFVCSFIYIFCYFNLKAGRTRLRYLIYYLIFYTENCLFCVSYFFYSTETNFVLKLILMLFVMLGFWVAITFQIVYYLHCHPSHKIRVCVRKDSKFYFVHAEMLKPTHLMDDDEIVNMNKTNGQNDDGLDINSQSQSHSESDFYNINDQDIKTPTSPHSNVVQSISNSFNNSICRKLLNHKSNSFKSKQNDLDEEKRSNQDINLPLHIAEETTVKNSSSPDISLSSNADPGSLLKLKDNNAITPETNRSIATKQNTQFESYFQSFSTYSSAISLNNDNQHDDKLIQSLNITPNQICPQINKSESDIRAIQHDTNVPKRTHSHNYNLKGTSI